MFYFSYLPQAYSYCFSNWMRFDADHIAPPVARFSLPVDPFATQSTQISAFSVHSDGRTDGRLAMKHRRRTYIARWLC